MEQSTGASAPAGRRERKKWETRRSIRRVALGLALELGPERLTVEAIAEAADVSPRTFFNYFACKEDALVTDLSAATAGLRSQVLDRPAHESPLQVLRVVVTENDHASLLHADRELARARQRLVQDNPSLMSRQLAQYQALERALAEALAQRLDLDAERDLRPALLAGVAVSVVRVALKRWTTGTPEPLAELLDAAFDLLEQGTLTDASALATA